MARDTPSHPKMQISHIYIYPIKALRAVPLPSSALTKNGFPHDRRFMLLHIIRNPETQEITEYKNIHIAHYPSSTRFFPYVDLEGELVKVAHKPVEGQGEERSVEFPLKPFTGDLETMQVEMHKSPTSAYKMPQTYSDFFSECYGFEVILAYLGESYRPVRMSSSLQQPTPSSWTSWIPSFLGGKKEEEGITFADCAPYLLVSQTSLENLSSRISEEFDILKFRPNIIISGAPEPWEEDFWGQVTIHSPLKTTEGIIINCIHNCARCKSINIDYSTGSPGTGPSGQMLKTMQKDRRVDPGMKFSPVFGRYSFLEPSSEGREIKVGDEVVVSKVLEGRTEFDWDGLSTLPKKK